jgi:hypothetical protein
MGTSRLITARISLTSLILLAACGGGGGGTAPASAPPPTPPADLFGVWAGTWTGTNTPQGRVTGTWEAELVQSGRGWLYDDGHYQVLYRDLQCGAAACSER